MSKKAYKILLKKRPDIPELSYIAGTPPVSAYNKWVKDQTNNTTKPSEKPSSNTPDSQPANQPDMNSPSPQPTDQPEKEEESVQKLLGGLTPQDALEYMKKTPDLVIVEVNAPEWKLKTGFTGALHIPYTEMEQRYQEIPQGRPVLLHCGGGIVSVPAYKILQEKRPDIPELSYIAGAPLVSEYNEWLASQ